ncbi:hypothetical protein F0562_030457 [Nyssa sinensis]|uniref:Transcriptional adapter 2-alpha/beta-like domain-containing protein n=1 Tax=Nyssa sinensis TaxID=561372 RepID=A0A5J5AYD6_9ASTE|nr:hypothetical protein F0562_030457 [Nyssa sinensis]
MDSLALGFPTPVELTLKEESPFSARVKIEDQRREGPPEMGSVVGSSTGNTSTGAVKSVSSMVQIKDGHDGIKVEDTHADRSIGEQKPRTSGDEEPAMTELKGYNSKRQEFETEYDNDAEQLLADMEFKDSENDAERELKLRVLRIYLKRLDERKRWKDFILERNLLYPNRFEKNLSPEEREIYWHYKVFMRFHSKEEHEELLRSVIEEHRVLQRIQDLQEAQAAGCRTSAEAERYTEQKRKREAEESAHRAKGSAHGGSSGKFLQRANHLKGELDGSPRGGARGSTVLDSIGMDSSSTTAVQAISSSLDDWAISGFVGPDLLSENKQLCDEIRIPPSHYLNMLQTMSIGVLNGNITKKLDAHALFKVDPSKVDRVYDMLVKKGIA